MHRREDCQSNGALRNLLAALGSFRIVSEDVLVYWHVLREHNQVETIYILLLLCFFLPPSRKKVYCHSNFCVIWNNSIIIELMREISGSFSTFTWKGSNVWTRCLCLQRSSAPFEILGITLIFPFNFCHL